MYGASTLYVRSIYALSTEYLRFNYALDREYPFNNAITLSQSPPQTLNFAFPNPLIPKSLNP
jgi:hypothetical protein